MCLTILVNLNKMSINKFYGNIKHELVVIINHNLYNYSHYFWTIVHRNGNLQISLKLLCGHSHGEKIYINDLMMIHFI